MITSPNIIECTVGYSIYFLFIVFLLLLLIVCGKNIIIGLQYPIWSIHLFILHIYLFMFQNVLISELFLSNDFSTYYVA